MTVDPCPRVKQRSSKVNEEEVVLKRKIKIRTGVIMTTNKTWLVVKKVLLLRILVLYPPIASNMMTFSFYY